MPLKDAIQRGQSEDAQRRLRSLEVARDDAKAEARLLRAELRSAWAENQRMRSSLSLLQGEGSPHSPWLVKNRNSSHHAIVMSVFSDAHIGEVVQPTAMNGYNKFDVPIARLRVKRFFTNQLTLTRTFFKGLRYDGAVLAIPGDVVSGGIHDELRETDALSVDESCEVALDWIGDGIKTLEGEFGKVDVFIVPGNHGRWGAYKKMPAKRVATTNADTHIGRLLKRDFRNNRHVNITVAEGASLDFQVYNTRFRMEHFYQAKGGTGISAAMAPLLLRLHRQRRVADAEGTPFDVLLGGHFHQLIFTPSQGLIVNGSIKGYDEYARDHAFAPEVPQQAFFMVTPENGITFPAPLFVANRKQEGW
ncbi:MAG: hypothetical protein KGJ86_00210 [Chloroflexota bacterium]|nr:hypothetical protein [Chloroflexota bacterium]